MLGAHVKILPASFSGRRPGQGGVLVGGGLVGGGLAEVVHAGGKLVGGVLARPRLRAQVHLQHAHSPAVDVCAAGKRERCRLLRRAVSRCLSAGGRQDGGFRIEIALLQYFDSIGIFPGSEDASDSGDAEITDFGFPVCGEKKVCRLHILMDQVVVVRVMEPARKLNGDIQQALLHFFRGPLIEGPVFDVPFQIAVLHPLREDGGHAANFPDVVTGNDVGMQAEIDPGIALMDEIVLAGLAGFRKILRLGALHSQIRVPAVVVHFPHASHAACESIGDHDVSVQNRGVPADHFGGDGICRHGASGSADGDIAVRGLLGDIAVGGVSY